jgi:DNA-binding NtrC family response regulator
VTYVQSVGDAPCSDLTLLIVEGEALVALGMASAFEEAGAKVTTTNSLEHAMILAENDGLSAAVIDHSLIDGDGTELRWKLARLEIPYIFYSGFEKPRESCVGVHGAKTATPDALISALIALFNGRGIAPS